MTDIEHCRQLARAFTRPALADIGRSGSAAPWVGLLKEHLDALGTTPLPQTSTAGVLFDVALQVLGATYPCEYVYKAAVANHLIFLNGFSQKIGLAVEQGVGSSIVDIATFDTSSTAYEIKTKYDSVYRLENQTRDYLRAFDRVYLVTHPDLAERHMVRADPRVGVLVVSEDGTLVEVRPAVSDVSRIEVPTVFRMLRRQEFMDAVVLHFGPQPELPNGLLYRHYEPLFNQLSSAAAHEVLVAAMRARSTTPGLAAFLQVVPPSLRALAFATPLSRPQRARVLSAMAEVL